MKENPNPDSEYELTDTAEKSTDEMLEEMELSPGDLVAAGNDPGEADVMKVDDVRFGEIHFHYPFVDHPQDARAGGPGAFDKPVSEWYADWKKGVLTPVFLEVNV